MHNERETAGIECGTDHPRKQRRNSNIRDIENYLRGSRIDCSRGLGETSDVLNTVDMWND